MATVAELGAGFADKVLSAQSTFRAVMDAMARPGSVQRISAASGTAGPMMPGTAAIALTLFDHDTPVWLDPVMAETRDVEKWIKFQTGAPLVTDPSVSSFALIANASAMPDLDRFAQGSSEYPDRSTTLIVQIASLTDGPPMELSGPGIDGVAELCAALAPVDLAARLAVNHALFPRGVDLVLVAGSDIVALPRTTRIVAKGA